MRQKKSMIMLIMVLIVLLVVYAALSQWNKKTEEKEAMETVQLVEEDSLSTFRYTDGQTTMSFIKENNIWYYKEDKEIPMSQNTVEHLSQMVTGLTAVRELKNPDALEDYGLKEPAYTIWYTAGEEDVPVYIGNMTGENYYVSVGDTGKVYTITNELVQSLKFDLSEMVEHDTVPNISSGNLVKVEVGGNAEDAVYETEDELAELAGGFGVLSFTNCADYHVTDDNLGSYGLDEGSRITVSATYTDADSKDEQIFTVYIGSEATDGANRYVMKEGSKMVYLVGKEVVSNMTTVGDEDILDSST